MPIGTSDTSATERTAAVGLLVNAALALGKLAAGIVGHSNALIADAIESMTDIVGSVIVWSGVRVAARPPSARHPYGYGKAESLAALLVSLMLLGAAVLIAIEAIHQIRTPHLMPAWWTLVVLVVVVVIKEALFRVARRAAVHAGSDAGEADAWHHRSDAVTSVAAFIGISVALVGGAGWEAADDWAALLASGVIAFSAVRLMNGPVRDLLDAQATGVVDGARSAALSVEGVRAVQKAFARKSGTRYFVDMHVWVDPRMTVVEAHRVAHAVKDRVKADNARVHDVLIHIEPAAETTKPASAAPEQRPSA